MGYQADRPMLRREKLKVAFPLIATTKKLCDDLTTEVGETGKTLVINSIKKKKKKILFDEVITTSEKIQEPCLVQSLFIMRQIIKVPSSYSRLWQETKW